MVNRQHICIVQHPGLDGLGLHGTAPFQASMVTQKTVADPVQVGFAYLGIAVVIP